MKFFWNDAKGLKADVERHRAKEKEYMDTIAKLEGSEDPMDVARLRAYRRFLRQLQDSKVAVVDKIGKKK